MARNLLIDQTDQCIFRSFLKECNFFLDILHQYWHTDSTSVCQNVEFQWSQCVFTGEVLQLWPFWCPFFGPNLSVSVWCWGHWVWYSRWCLIRVGKSLPSPYWPPFFWSSPGHGWLSGLQTHAASSYTVFCPPVQSKPMSIGLLSIC